MVLTLDDSGSMRWAFAPDAISGTHATRRAKSSDFNPLYFNPIVTYNAPIVFDTSGNEQQLSTSYSAARLNGYKSTYGNIDLRSNYKFTWSYDLLSTQATSYGYSSTSNRLGENPTTDFTATVARSTNGTSAITNAGITFSITRTGSNSCTATATASGVSVTADCSRTANNTYTASLTQRGVPAYYYTYNSTLATNCTKANDNCYQLHFVSSDQQQNFANWYSFYRNRALATISAAALAFYDLSSSVRLTWQGLGNCTTLNGGSTTNCHNNQFQEFSPAHKGQLYAWMQNINFDQSTYLPAAMKRAGEFYSTSTPWQRNPNGSGNTAQNTYACRASYHILMTDGQWNATTTMPGNFRHDAASFTLPDGNSYSERRPFYDSQNQTLADLAMHYWATDLNPNLNNRVPAYTPAKSGNATTEFWDPRNDPATWQHMTNFVMGLGLTESLNNSSVPWAGGTFTGEGYANLVSGTANWPAASSGSANNVYDLWHSAINSRGEFFSVDSPDAMVTAFSDILSRIAARKSTASRPAMNSGQVTEDEIDGTKITTVSYQTTYASDDNWSGDLIRTEKTRTLNPLTGAYQDAQRTVWQASAEMPTAGSRNIYIPTTSGNLQAFTWTNAGNSTTPGTLANLLSRDPENGNAADAKGEARLDFLRGDRSLENTDFRQRTSVLGDLYSSTPVGVSKARYLVNIANSIEDNTAYTTFEQSMRSRKGMVYVGGNDGMLHGFNAQTGREEFAFIPTAVFPNLNKLTGRNYNHHFYVDGSPVVADVYDSGSWKTILVGTLRAGGKSVFALDVTDPDNIRLLWEFDDSKITNTNAVKMGYSFSKPSIARLNTGRWAVVFGNGYEAQNHTNGKAALFVLDAVNGTLLKSLEVAGTEGLANGLSTPKLSDYNADGIAEFAYAGDLQGNLWRFNLHASTANSFSVAYGGEPMFSAVSSSEARQHITAAPSLVRHPTGNGYLVIFGTGKYFEDSDKDGDKSMAQTLYGIWDRYTRLTSEDISASNSAMPISRSNLVEQTIDTETTATNQAGQSLNARTISDNLIAWYDADGDVDKLGWRLDFRRSALDGEMVVDDMTTLGRSLFLQTLVPNDDPCADGASNWTYAINPHSGGRLRHNALILTPSSASNGVIPSGQQQPGEGGLTIAQKPDGNFEICTGTTCNDVRPDPASIGRQTWRIIEDIEE